MIVAAIYILVLCAIIHFSAFFKESPFAIAKFRILNIVFLLKVLAGFALTWVYTKYYTDRQSADIFKYYDDARIMFSAVQKHHYADYLKMIFGFSNDSAYFDDNYYRQMNHWYRQYDFGTYNDNHTIIRFNALVMLFSFGSFHVHTVVMCFVSLCGLTALYKAFKAYVHGKEKTWFLAIFLAPSVIFWTSGVLKEGILIFALGFLMYSFINLVNRQRLVFNIVVLLISVYLLLINKNYLLLAVAPALSCFWLAGKLKLKRPFWFYLAAYGLVFFGALLLNTLFFDNNILQTLSQKHRDFIAVSKGGVFLQNGREFARIAPDKKIFLDTLSAKNFKIKPGSQYMYWKNENLNDTIFIQNSADTSTYYLVWDLPLAGSAIATEPLQPSYGSLFKTAPVALYNSLCKPGFLTAKTVFEKIAALENVLVLLFLLACAVFSGPLAHRNLFAFCFFLSLTVLLLIGFTTPVAGAIVRYKVPVLPFMLLAGILVLKPGRLPIFSPKTKA